MTTVTGYLNFVASLATPTPDARAKASNHRAEIEAFLKSDLGVYRIFETGSWSHGTAAWPWSDVDYFASMPGVRASTSAGDLEKIRSTLARNFPGISVRVSRPAVRVSFPDGPYVEIVPAHVTSDDDYFIPAGQGAGWMKSSPLKHKEYVNKSQDTVPQTKRFIRLLKEWKNKQNVPISSLYLEMRAAKHVRDHKPWVDAYDFAWFFRDLERHDLSDMNDPSRFDGRRLEAVTDTQRSYARESVRIAARSTALALDCYKDGNESIAAQALQILFD